MAADNFDVYSLELKAVSKRSRSYMALIMEMWDIIRSYTIRQSSGFIMSRSTSLDSHQQVDEIVVPAEAS